MKFDSFHPDFPKLGSALFNSFKILLKALCKPLPILFAESSTPFYSFCVCLVWSHILNLASLVVMSRCIWIPTQMSSIAFVLIYPSSESSSIDNSSFEAKMYLSSS